ncbi:WD40 repeat-like protein, partial [Aureobasidium melanogenum]
MASDLGPKAQLNAPTESRSGLRHEIEGLCHHDHEHESHKFRHHDNTNDENISIPSNSKHAEQAIAPFLAKHIPTQYNPVGHLIPQSTSTDLNHDHHQDPSSTKFCYRHRPDLKCRRQANEPSMEQLQNELGTVSQSDQQAISHVWSLFSAAPSKHRNLMLQGILSQCCFPQLSYISASVRDLIKIDFLSALPPELGFRILCFLDTTSLCKAAQVSRRWRSLADDDVVWHRMCEQHIDRKCTKCGWGLPLLERKRLRIEKRQIQLRAISRGNNEWSPAITPLSEDPASVNNASITPNTQALAIVGEKRKFEDEQAPPQKKLCTPALGEEEVNSYFQPQTRRPWKDVYKDRFKVGTNWKYGRCSTKIFRGHTNGVMCLQFDENVLITGSYDCTVKVWDIKTGTELRTLEGHTSGIRTLQFDDQKLITGSMDNTTKVWDWRTGKCLRTFQAHTGGVICVNFDAGYIASGSMDHTIRVYEIRNKASYLLKGHTDWVNAVKLDVVSRTLLSASDDCTVRLWDLDTRRCIKVFEGHVGQVQQLVALPPEFELDEADLLSGENEDDTSSTSSGPSPAHKHSHHPASTSPESVVPFWPDEPDRPAPPRYMLTGALDSTIRLWDVHAPAVSPAVDAANPVQKPPTTNACLRTYFGHVEGIWALAADHLRMVSGSEDRTVKIWDPRSGKCERTWTGHAGPVTCIGLSDSRLVSGSEDCEVRMLLFNTGEGGEGCEEQ